MAKTAFLKELPQWLIAVLTIVLFFVIIRGLKRVSFLEAEKTDKEALKRNVTKYMDENKTTLEAVKFNVVSKFQDITEDKEVIKNVMKAAMKNDRATLDEILKSL